MFVRKKISSTNVLSRFRYLVILRLGGKVIYYDRDGQAISTKEITVRSPIGQRKVNRGYWEEQ